MAKAQHAISGLYTRYRHEIRNHIAAKLSCREDIDDLSQEVFLRAHRALETQTVDHPRAYLHRIACSVITDHFRRGQRRSAPSPDMTAVSDDSEIAAWGPTPEESAIGDETVEAVEAAIARLPAKARQAIVLRVTEELSYLEVAHRMGISVKTAEKHLARGMANLRASVRQ